MNAFCKRQRKTKSARRPIRRGDVYYADLTPVQGSEQGGVRPVVVIQNDVGNHFSPTTIVAVITGKSKFDLPTHVGICGEANLDKSSSVLLEQIRTVDKSRLTDYVATLRDEDMRRVDKALGVSVGI